MQRARCPLFSIAIQPISSAATFLSLEACRLHFQISRTAVQLHWATGSVYLGLWRQKHLLPSMACVSSWLQESRSFQQDDGAETPPWTQQQWWQLQQRWWHKCALTEAGYKLPPLAKELKSWAVWQSHAVFFSYSDSPTSQYAGPASFSMSINIISFIKLILFNNYFWNHIKFIYLNM